MGYTNDKRVDAVLVNLAEGLADTLVQIGALERRIAYLEEGHRPSGWKPDPQDVKAEAEHDRTGGVTG